MTSGRQRIATLPGVVVYGGNLTKSYQRFVTFVDRIFRGAKPGELPVEQPSELELVINLKTARALDLAIRRAMLLRADRMIE
jgi:putative ABC transport system substrate-binding protein